MANKTVYPFGTGGQLPSSIGVVNDLTTGGADKALSAEMGKVLGDFKSALTSSLEYNEIEVTWAYPQRKIALDGTISSYYAVSTSAPIALKAGEEIRVTFASKMNTGNAVVVISLTDSSSSAYTPVVDVNYTGGTVFYYKAAADCYVAISCPRVSSKEVATIVEIKGASGSSNVTQAYKDEISDVNTAIVDISSYINPYEVLVEWDSHDHNAYRPSSIIANTGYTYIKEVGDITHIRARLLGDSNNFSLVFFDAAGTYIPSISVKNSAQFDVDMDIPDGAAKFGVWNLNELPPIVIATMGGKLETGNLDELYSTFLRKGYRQLTSADMLSYRGYVKYSTQKVVYGGDIGMVSIGKIKDITEIVFSSVGRTDYSALAYFDKGFNAISLEAVHSGTKTIISTPPAGAVYFAATSAIKTDYPIYVKEAPNKYNLFASDVERRLAKNIVGNPYKIVAEQEVTRPYMRHAAITANSTTIYVSSTGSDTNAGTSANPVKTIAKALQLAQGYDRNIEIADGTYRIDESINIANTGHYIRMYAPNGNARIKGSALLASPTDEGNGIISFAYSGGQILHEIFVNDEVRFPASAGNDVPSELVEATYTSYSQTNLSNGYKEFKIVMGAADVAKLANYIGVGYVTFYRDWRSIVGVIKSVDTTNNTISIYVAPSFKTNTVEGVYGGVQKIVVKNINETLDCYSQPSLRAGSFFYDIPNNRLYYKLAEGETAANVSVEVPLPVSLTINSPCLFYGLRFSQFGGTLFNSQAYSGACIDHQGGYCMDGVFKVYSAETSFYKCEFSGFTLHCVKFYNGSSDCSVVNCFFHENGCGAVMIGERDKDATNVPSNIYVHHNVTKMSGQCLPESCAFVMTFADACEFTNNTIAYSSYSAFNIGYVWYRDTAPTGLKICLIKGNDISHVGHPWSNDLGAIYTLGDTQGLRICGNYIHDIYSVDANRNGIYLDEGTKNAYVYNNVVKMGFNHSHNNRLNYVFNNVFSGQYYINNQTIDLTIYGNIFIGISRNIYGNLQPMVKADSSYPNVVDNLYWGDGCDTITSTVEKSPSVFDPNFTDFNGGDFTIYDTENVDKISFQSFQLVAGAKGCEGEDVTFDWFSYE